ncbi:MAG: TonB-dependent receptor [Candidatus Sulfotelmatobacter sp.]
MIFGRLPLPLIQVVLGSIVLASSLGAAQAPTESGPAPQSAPANSGNTSPENKPPKKPELVTVITVTGEPLNPSLAPASVSVMDGQQVQNSDASTSADIMREVPFVNLEQNGSEGSLSTLTIRGGKPNLVLMLIDGIAVNDLTNLLGGSFDFSTLLTRDVEQIEIVRGPLSSGYGSEAMSGVINVITRPSHYETNLTAGLETGSFGAAGINVGAEGSQGRLGYKLSGQFLRIGDQVESDAFSASTFSASSDFVRNSRESLSWTLRWIQFQGSSFPPNGGGPELSVLKIPGTDNAGNFLAGFHFQHRFSQWWGERIDADVFTRGDHSYTPPILDSPNPGPLSQPSDLATTHFTRPRLNAQSVFDLSPKWTGHFNATIADEIGSNHSILESAFISKFSTNRGVTDLSGDLEFITTRMTAMAAVGIGKTAGFTTQVAPRVGVALTVAKNTIAKASWGEGYRVPDLYALENPEVGNPSLVPEKVMGMDAGLEHSFNHFLTLSGTYYDNLFSNLIDFSATEFRLVNRTRVRTDGVETEASFSLPHGIQVKAWGSSLNWNIESTSEPLRDEPDWQAGFNIAGRFRQFRASGTTLWVGRRYDYQLPAPNIDTVGGYSVTNLILGYEGFRRVALFARVDNLFDRRFHEYLGFPNPGISCRVGLTYRLR